MALRIAVLGVVAIVVFCALFFRLWALQVISGEQYLEDAKNNQIRTFGSRRRAARSSTATATSSSRTCPGRSSRSGRRRSRTCRRRDATRSCAGSRACSASGRGRCTPRWSAALENDPLTPITIRADVGELKTAYLMEHQSEFPGVQITETYLRHYDQGTIGAQILGYVGEITAEQLKSKEAGRLRGRRPDRADRASRPPTTRTSAASAASGSVYVDALGRMTSQREFSQLPEAGRQHPPDDRRRPPAHRPRTRSRTASAWRTTRANGRPTAARSSRWT